MPRFQLFSESRKYQRATLEKSRAYNYIVKLIGARARELSKRPYAEITIQIPQPCVDVSQICHTLFIYLLMSF